MSNLSIKYEDIGFKPIGEGNNDAASVLYAQINVAGLACHMEAYEVSADSTGHVTAVNPHFAHCVEALLELNGLSLSTVELQGRDYVIGVYPKAAN